MRVSVLDTLDRNLIEAQQKHVYQGDDSHHDEKFGHKTASIKLC